MQAARGVRPAEMFAGAVWTVLIGGTIIGTGYLAYTLTGGWNFFLRVLARGAILAVGFPLLMLLLSGAGALWEDVWGAEREPIGSGWLAKTVAVLCTATAALVVLVPGFARGPVLTEAVGALAFGSVALLASPSIEGRWRRGVATALAALLAVSVGSFTADLLADDAPGFWSALLVAFMSPTFWYGLYLAVAFWLCRWTRRRLEARATTAPTPTIDPAA